MSRVGKIPIVVPSGVSVEIKENVVEVKGKLGKLNQCFSGVAVKLEDDKIVLTRLSDSKENRSKHGLYRALINNMLIGVSKGFTRDLEFVGVGYRAVSKGQKLDLTLGFSHNIVMEVPEEIRIEAKTEKGKNPLLKLMSHDKQLVGEVAAKIRSFRKPEPYKGKGIKFVGEQLRRKAGKSA